jgi:carbon monoxide dehydrogenase subunit G
VVDRAERGFLVLADLSGFTRFMTTAELEHGPEITKTLLETIIARLSPPLEVQEIEGDAVFAFLFDRALSKSGTLLDLLEGTYVGFREKQRAMQLNTTCTCNACRAIPTLALKLVAHHGSFLVQTVGGRRQLAGADVIVAHRLLKNSVPGQSYLLLSDAALARTGLEPAACSLVPHADTYEHLGEVRFVWSDLEPVWKKAAETSTVRVDPARAFLSLDYVAPVTPAVVWDWLVSPERRMQWMMGISSFTQKSPGRMGVGALSHCAHGNDSLSAETVVDWRPFRSVTRDYRMTPGGFLMRETTDLEPTEGGTRVSIRCERGEMGFVKSIVFRAMQGKVRKMYSSMSENLVRLLQAEASATT